MAKKKSAREKLHIDRQPEVCEMTLERQVRLYGPGKMLIPVPTQVDAIIREIPEGQVREAAELRNELAKRHGANVTCPLCFGIFWRLSAEAAEEDRAEGREDITPYWRVVKEKGKLNEKLPGGLEAHAGRLAAEGHAVDGGRVQAMPQ
jgi:alkylated DNA nucleotide flippase Atl1